MKIKELLKLLQEMNEDAIVVMETNNVGKNIKYVLPGILYNQEEVYTYPLTSFELDEESDVQQAVILRSED